MTRLIHIGTPPIAVHLHRSARARRLSLRVSNADGTVRLTMPARASERAALDFARDHEGWLRKALGRRPAALPRKAGVPTVSPSSRFRLAASATEHVKAGLGRHAFR